MSGAYFGITAVEALASGKAVIALGRGGVLESAPPSDRLGGIFYQRPEERVPILSIKVAADVPAAQRTAFKALKTDSPTFAAVVHNRRFRRDAWYKLAAGHIDVCNLPLPVRAGP